MMDIKQKILDSGKITKKDLDKKISDKVKSLPGLISEDGAAHIIASELGIRISEETNNVTPLKISALVGGMKSVTIIARVIKKYDLRTFGEEGSGKVLSLLMGDDSGIARLTFWNDKCDLVTDLKEGDIIEIQNAYTKENNARVEVHMGNSSNCIINPEGKTVELIQKKEIVENPKRINELNENDTYVDLVGTIVQVYDPRFFEVCPECNKRMQIADGNKFRCPEHGVKEPKYNSVMNIFLDDGTDNIRATLWKEQIQSLLGKTEKELVDLKNNSQELDRAKNDLLGRIIKVRGKVSKNEAFNNLELVLYKIDLNPTPEEESKSLPKEKPKEKVKEEIKPKKPKQPAKEEVVEEEVDADNEEELFNVEDLEDEFQI
jgi:ssDNA-binding replication factor A large subunit